MAIHIQSTKAQQNFGEYMEKAVRGEDVIVERYGEPRAVIVSHQRYEALLAAERELPQLRLKRAAAIAEARAAYLSDDEVEALIEQARREVHEGREEG
jgi:prevent-host-death family protein